MTLIVFIPKCLEALHLASNTNMEKVAEVVLALLCMTFVLCILKGFFFQQEST